MINFKGTLYILTYIIIFALGTGINGQIPSSLLPKTPASPTAKELGKYGAMPVSYYTGTLIISIPLYEFKCGTYTLPITLNYHASGIKVNDIASWVGLGWSLSAGGGITVGPKGKFDFSRDRLDIRTKEDLMELDLPTDDQLEWLYQRIIDSEPDVYNYNFCGYSGQFVLDEEFKVHFLKNHDGIKIECFRTYYPDPCGNGDCGHWEAKFIATDKKGIKYHFGVFESTFRSDYTRGYDIEGNTFDEDDPLWHENNIAIGEIEATNWMITKIEFENKIDHIDFNYHTEVTKYQTGYSGTLIACNEYNCEYGYNNFSWHIGEQALQYSLIENTTQVLDMITYSRDGSKIVFKSDHQREDMVGTHALTEIEVWNTTERIIVWDFNYSQYFISNKSIGNDLLGNPLNKRLKLNKLTQYSGDKTKSLPPYQFKYFGDDEGEYQLPPRNCFDGFDHWGYCNKDIIDTSEHKPGTLFPKLQDEGTPAMYFICVHSAFANPTLPNQYSTFTSAPPVPNFTNGGVRSPDGNFGKSNTLKEITYPTGGKTMFEFEGHKYKIIASGGSYGEKACGGIRIKKIEDSNDGINTITRNFEYGSGVVFGEPVYILPKFTQIESYGLSSFMTCGNTWGAPSPTVGGYYLYSNSIESLYLTGADYICYTRVTENTGNGSILYSYYSGADYNLCYDYYYAYTQTNGTFLNDFYSIIACLNKPLYPLSIDFLSGEYKGDSFKRGLIKDVLFKDINGKNVKHENYTYDAIEGEIITGNRVAKVDDEYYFIDAYEIPTGKSFLTTKTVTEYDIDNSTNIQTIYSYTHNTYFEQLRTETVINSNGDTLKTAFIYPTDIYEGNYYGYTPEACGIYQLILNYRISEPIEVTTELNDLMINASLLTFINIDPNVSNSLAVPYREYLIESNVPFIKENTEITYNPGNGLYELTIDPQYMVKGEYECDQYGNIISYMKTDDLIESVFYGYNNSLPVIKARNITYNYLNIALNEITDSFNDLLETIGDLKLQSQKTVWKSFNNELRSYYILIDALLTTYTYKPLIGITSETDPSGKTTYYEYDDFGRLETIRDDDGNVIEHRDYNYIND